MDSKDQCLVDQYGLLEQADVALPVFDAAEFSQEHVSVVERYSPQIGGDVGLSPENYGNAGESRKDSRRRRRVVTQPFSSTRGDRRLSPHYATANGLAVASGQAAGQIESTDHYPGFLARVKAVVQAWLAAPSQVASLCPSSHALTRAIADHDFIRQASVVVELGPGTGGTTRALLQEMKPESRLVAIEKTDTFIEPLQKISDARLSIAHGDAVDLQGILKQNSVQRADVVVSGIPFSSIPKSAATAIVKAVDAVLPVGGTFVAYQLRDDVTSYAQPLFGTASVDRVWFNIPPLKVFCWQKS